MDQLYVKIPLFYRLSGHRSTISEKFMEITAFLQNRKHKKITSFDIENRTCVL